MSMFHPFRHVLMPTIVAMATCCVCSAQDYIPLTCAEFEKRFPKAIKYPQHGYYTLRVPNSAAVCFYNARAQLSFAVVLTGAKENATKFAEALHMTYDENATVPASRARTVLLFNKRARPLLTGNVKSSSIYLPSNNTFLMAALIQLGNTETSRCQFVNWAARGMTFLYTNTHYGQTNVVFSPADNTISRIHLYPRNTTDNTYHLLRHFNKTVLNAQSLDAIEPKEQYKMRRTFNLMEVYAADAFESILFGKIKQGKYVIGRHDNRRLNFLASPRPADLPAEESRWPTPARADDDTSTQKQLSQSADKTKNNHAPPSPIQALNQYLERLNNMFK